MRRPSARCSPTSVQARNLDRCGAETLARPSPLASPASADKCCGAGNMGGDPRLRNRSGESLLGNPCSGFGVGRNSVPWARIFVRKPMLGGQDAKNRLPRRNSHHNQRKLRKCERRAPMSKQASELPQTSGRPPTPDRTPERNSTKAIHILAICEAGIALETTKIHAWRKGQKLIGGRRLQRLLA